MASRTERTRVFTGGLNLLSPVDKLNPGQSLVRQNFRVDKGDELRARYGITKRAGPIGSGEFHTLKRFDEAEFAGIGTNLYYGPGLQTHVASFFDGQPMDAVFYQHRAWFMNTGKQISASIGIQASVLKWGVDPPATAPVATGGGQLTTPIQEFDAGAGIDVAAVSPPSGANEFTDYLMQNGVAVPEASTADFDTANKRSGSASLRLQINGATSITTSVNLNGADLRVDGQAQDEDVIRFWFFASDPSQISKITVYVRTGKWNDANRGYVEYSFTNPQKWLNQALNSWTQLKINRRLNLDDWTQRIAAATAQGDQQNISDLEAQFSTAIAAPTFLYTGTGWPQTGIGSAPPATLPPSAEMLRIDWSNIDAFGITVQTSSAVQVNYDLAEVVGTVGANSSGAITYFVSFAVNQQDSNPSPASNSVIAGQQTITLTKIPVTTDPVLAAGSANHSIDFERWIYRIGGGLSQALRVGVIADNTTTTFQDLMSNSEAQADDLVMPINRDLPPPAKGVEGPIFGKLIAYNTNEHPARYFWTESGNPWYFPGANDDAVGNWEDAGGDDDGILKITDHRPITMMYKGRSIWRLIGDPATSDPTRTASHVGTVGKRAVVNAGACDYFVGPEGVYSHNFDFETRISQAIDPIFKGDYVQLNDGEWIAPVDLPNIGKCVIELVGGGDQLRVSYPSVLNPQLNGIPNTVLIYHIPSGQWGTEIFAAVTNAAVAYGFSAMLNEGASRGFVMGATGPDGGYMYQQGGSGVVTDAGSPFTTIWQSGFMDQGLPDNYKVYTDVEVDCETMEGGEAPSTLFVFMVYDNGTKVQVGTLQSSNSAKPRFTGIIRLMDPLGIDVGRTAKNAAIRLECAIGSTVVIWGVYLHWYPEERVARSFDSGPTDFGMPERVKQVDYVEMYMTSAGQKLERVLASDLPGNVLTRRDDTYFQTPAGRGTVRQRLAAIVEGRNFRFSLSDAPSLQTYQLHKVRARMRPIGEYIDGTINEYYESPEFSVAPGRVGELKDFLLDYDVSGAGGRLEIYTDLPGNLLTLERTLPIPAFGGRAPFMFALENPRLSGPSMLATSLPYGQLFKVRLYPPPGGILRLHGRATFRARIIGVYFDGSAGEIWETQPLDLLGGMSIFRELSIVSQSAGPMTLEMRTELPGQNMNTIARFTVNTPATTAGRLPFIGRLPGNTKGRLQQFRLVGPYVTRLLEAKVYARRVQSPDTEWNWIPIPVEVTPDAWAEIAMPVRQTPEEFAWIDLSPDPIQ